MSPFFRQDAQARIHPEPLQNPPVNQPSFPDAPARRHSLMEETDDELTEDEREAYEKGIITWEKAKHWRFWLRREWLWWYVGLVVIIVLVALLAFFHRSIVDWLTPFTQRIRTVKDGWLIPVALMFVLSFPPLFGNEILMVLVGVVWGLGRGFAIVTVGTILGEVANYAVFKYWCRGRADRLARTNLNYACLARAIEEGGIIMAWLVRLSVIPTHFTTVVFAVCGLPFWKFFIALIGGLPKQLITVYSQLFHPPVVLARNSGTNSHVVSDLVFLATAIISLGCLWFIYRKMASVRRQVILDMRKDLQKHHIATSEPPLEIEMGEKRRFNWRHPFGGSRRQNGKMDLPRPLTPPEEGFAASPMDQRT
ncbi:hypothetical protein M231_02699 [Tremella mesenterica]|uniref:Golgi apparatus membrane protein TVP38 n=1 Tax=Tremella mesenterica TaxID=5217 RepID=A0A4Q1BQ62_TREME|nr:hypothetical protein M231_02699 [Tremella mesenterica]